MKNQKLLCLIFLSSILIVKGQEGEGSPPTNPPLLLALIKNSESNINFNTLENFNTYGNTSEIDLNRKTVAEEIILASKSEYYETGISLREGGIEPGEIKSINNQLPADILTIDNIDFHLSGYNKIRSLGKRTIILGVDTVNRWGENFKTISKADVGRLPHQNVRQGDISWDGTNNVGVVQDGTYIYTLELQYCGQSNFERICMDDSEVNPCVRYVGFFCTERISGCTRHVNVIR